MKSLRVIFAFGVLFLIQTSVSFAERTSIEERTKPIEEFLVRLGFDDYSQLIRDDLAVRPTGDKDKDENREWNADRYEIKNAVRRLGARIGIALEDATQLPPEKRQTAFEELTELICQSVAYQPYNFDPRVPSEVLAVPEKRREDSYIEYQQSKMTGDAYRQAKRMTANYLEVIYGNEFLKEYFDRIFASPKLNAKDLEVAEDIIQIQKDIYTATTFMWTDASLGHTRFLGEAILLTVERFVRQNPGNESFIRRLKKQLKHYGAHYENFVGDTPVVTDRYGDEVKMGPIKNGDMAGERTREHEADQITSSVIPHRGRTAYAWSHGLINPLRAMLYQVIDKNTIYEKPLWKRPFLWALYYLGRAAAKTSSASRGISHIGSLQRLEDPETGIVRLRVIDMYPGGIRELGFVDAFAEAGDMMKIGYSRENPKKVYEEFHRQAKARKEKYGNSYVQAIWPSDLEYLDEKGRIIPGKEKFVKFPVTTSEEKYRELESLNAEELTAALHRFMFNQIIDDYLIHRGEEFQYGFGEGFYCASTRCVALMQSGLYDPEVAPDRFRLLLRTLNFLSTRWPFNKVKKLDEVREMDMSKRIVGPSGLFAADTVDLIDLIRYPRTTEQQQKEASTEAERLAIDSKTEILWERNREILYRRMNEQNIESAIDFGDDPENIRQSFQDGFTRANDKTSKSRRAGRFTNSRTTGNHSPIDRCLRQINHFGREARKVIFRDQK